MWVCIDPTSSGPNLSENPMFSSIKLLTGPPVEMAVGSLVEPVTAPVEP